MEARKRWVAPVVRCSFCNPNLRDPPGTYSITDARLPCTQPHPCLPLPVTRQYHLGQDTLLSGVSHIWIFSQGLMRTLCKSCLPMLYLGYTAWIVL